MASKQDAQQPPQTSWVRLVHELERAIARPIEAAVRSDEYFDLLTQLNRARARVTKTVEGVSEEWLHLFNLPTATDLRKVREQLTRVERQLNKVGKALGDSEEASEEPRRQLAQLGEQLAEIAKTLDAVDPRTEEQPKAARASRPKSP